MAQTNTSGNEITPTISKGSMAVTNGCNTSPYSSKIKMIGKLVAGGAWVSWFATNAPDITGAQYSGGASALITATIQVS